MATAKKQVSKSKKPKNKNVTTEAEVKNTVVENEVKAIVAEKNNAEDRPRFITSRRVWPD
ncbi:hypothetical protein MNBD_GAMMA16-1463 [hydrothermal vent metagenome]|uniref:Uncharacterized protein n=1 Tax=hydrothermal vent metagenome TaxID=652676 RepID=A0A3B0ZCS1_9ZZZZ